MPVSAAQPATRTLKSPCSTTTQPPPPTAKLQLQLHHHRPLRIMETHSGLSGLVVEQARATRRDGDIETEVEFDGMWSSSLTASALRGLPDIETVDTTARLALVQETLAVTTKPLIYDADTGGQPEVFRYTVRALLLALALALALSLTLTLSLSLSLTLTRCAPSSSSA